MLVTLLVAPHMYVVKSRKFGLILYNPSDRDGAVEEADNLQSGLQAVGCQVFREEWITKRELSTLIDEGVRKAAGCSLLVVCIMSLGTAGTYECHYGYIVFNDVLLEFTRKVAKEVPTVR